MIGSDAPYEIVRATGKCAATGRALEPGEAIVVALAEVAGESALHRLEFSMAAWDEGARPQPPARAFAIWNTERPDAEDTRVVRMDDEDLLSIFGQLESASAAQAEDAGSVGAGAMRYLLALFLMRRRLLIPTGEGEGGALVLSPRGLGRRVLGDDDQRVDDPGLTDDQLEDACQKLGDLLGLEGGS